jgi:hypothetical protein
VREAVREVAERPAGGVELLLDPRPVGAGLDLREPRHRVDAQHAVEPAHVDGDHRPRLVHRRLQAAGDVRPGAERDHDRVRVQGGPEQRGQLLLAPRAHHEVRNPPEVTATRPHEVAQALAARVHHPVHRLDRDRRDRLQARAQRRVDARLGDVQRLERDRGRRRAPDVHLEVLQHERTQRGLVLVRERDLLLAPAPPLHVG